MGGEAVAAARRRGRGSRGPRRARRRSRPCRAPPRRGAQDDLPAARVDDDVARDLGDGGGDQRRVGAREARGRSASARASARAGTRSASRADRERCVSSRHRSAPGAWTPSSMASASSRSRAVCRGSRSRSNCTMAIATSGRMPDDDGARAPQARRDRDRPQRPRDEGVDDVERGDVDDEPAGAEAADPLGELVAQRQHLPVGQVGLDRGDQVVALAEDGDRHDRRLVSVATLRVSVRVGAGRGRAGARPPRGHPAGRRRSASWRGRRRGRPASGRSSTTAR